MSRYSIIGGRNRVEEKNKVEKERGGELSRRRKGGVEEMRRYRKGGSGGREVEKGREWRGMRGKRSRWRR